jgi:hypothetical protein
VQYKNVQDAIKEAERFILKAKEVEKEKPYRCIDGTMLTNLMPNHGANAACKRASLDLTKALSKMRLDC